MDWTRNILWMRGRFFVIVDDFVAQSEGLFEVSVHWQTLGDVSLDDNCFSVSQELDESILDCLKREVKEETGLNVITAIPMAIYSQLSIMTAYGDPYHLFLVQFLVDDWSGELATETEETVDARFFRLNELPEKLEVPEELRDRYQEVLEDLREYDGSLILK